MLIFLSQLFRKTLIYLLFFASGAVFSGTASAAVDLPDMGDSARAALSTVDEKRLGQMFMRNIQESGNIIDDAEVNAYIQSLGYRLVGNIDHPEFNFRFFVVGDDTINAFAGPGGHVGVNSGLILATRSESELAAVLAHEISHVTQHHIARSIAEAQKSRLPLAVGLLASILMGIANPQMGMAALTATEAGSMQHQLNFTRAHEKEADRIGIELLERAGFDPMAMADFFERLEQMTRVSQNNVPEFLQTHPVTQNRIAEARSRARQLMGPGPVEADRNSLNYHLMRARLRVLTAANPNNSITYFKTQLESEGLVVGARLGDGKGVTIKTGKGAGGAKRIDRVSNAYGYAEALMSAGRYDEARPIIGQLLDEQPHKVTYLIARAQIDLGTGAPEAALQIFDNALKLYPHSHALIVTYAHALLQSNRPEQATRLLQRHMRNSQSSPDLYGLLARAQGEAGNAVEAHQSLAEYYYLTGQTDTAIEQLKIALSLSKEQDDLFQTPRIKARLEQLKQEAQAESH